ncbi:MAG: SGNH/GDSL hydrolase family protein [Chloroflexi bacterium]|nr:SGNH/GDSL hydrolase family protein [Chloroflexota bacterium]
MKILVLGNSDTAGSHVSGTPWPHVAASLLAQRGVTVTGIDDVGFSAVGARAAAFAERKVRELEPDLVILPVGTFAYTVGFVWVQVRHRFGVRAASLYQKLERGFERRTGAAGGGSRSKARLSVNRAGRKLVRTVVGSRPLTTQAELTESYRQILGAIARVEAVDVLIVDYPAETGPLAKKKLATPARRAQFLADIHEAAASHRYRMLVADDVFGRFPEGSLSTPDGFHLNDAGHQVLGEAVAAVIMQGGPEAH